MNDFETDPDLESAANVAAAKPDAFATAIQGESFAGQPLKPWNPSRKIASQAMGMLYPFIGDDGFESLERTGLYPGAQRDVIIFMWLRVQHNDSRGSDISESTVMRAQRKPREAWALAEEWAASAGLVETSSREFEEAYQIFTQKMSGIETLQGRPPQAPATPAAEQTGTSLPKV